MKPEAAVGGSGRTGVRICPKPPVRAAGCQHSASAVQMLPYILTLTFLFYPEPKEAAYEISRIMGECITSDQIRGTFFEKIIDIFLKTHYNSGRVT